MKRGTKAEGSRRRAVAALCRAAKAERHKVGDKKSSENSVPLCLCASVPSFTLIELLIVMVVITALVGITIPISKYVTYRARMANRQIEIEKIKGALEDYRAAYGEYPITPSSNIVDGLPQNYADALRHYPDHYATECYYTTNSPFTNVVLATNTAEMISTDDGSLRGIDYSLTYPLMLRQRAEGARPFMEFKEVTVVYLVYKQVGDTFKVTRKRRLKGGAADEITKEGVYGKPVNRPKAIDPVSQKQWKYTSEDGVTYTLTNYTENYF